MMATYLDKPKLRELVLDFYVTYDPQRLKDGIDINGMVNWTFENGLHELNKMLYHQYGAEIDASKEVNNNEGPGFNRVSVALMGPMEVEGEAEMREQLTSQLTVFYQRYDPSKLSALEKLVDFAVYRGVDLLNAKLYDKYGDDLRSYPPMSPLQNHSNSNFNSNSHAGLPRDDLARLSPLPEMKLPAMSPVANFGSNYDDAPMPPSRRPSPPPRVPQQPAPIQNQNSRGPPPPPPSATLTLPPPPVPDDEIRFSTLPPPPPVEDYIDPDEIEGELRRYYAVHDPGKLDVVEALATWVLKIGRIEFNKKLLQIYGSTLDDPLPEPQPEVPDDFLAVDANNRSYRPQDLQDMAQQSGYEAVQTNFGNLSQKNNNAGFNFRDAKPVGPPEGFVPVDESEDGYEDPEDGDSYADEPPQPPPSPHRYRAEPKNDFNDGLPPPKNVFKPTNDFSQAAPPPIGFNGVVPQFNPAPKSNFSAPAGSNFGTFKPAEPPKSFVPPVPGQNNFGQNNLKSSTPQSSFEKDDAAPAPIPWKTESRSDSVAQRSRRFESNNNQSGSKTDIAAQRSNRSNGFQSGNNNPNENNALNVLQSERFSKKKPKEKPVFPTAYGNGSSSKLGRVDDNNNNTTTTNNNSFAPAPKPLGVTNNYNPSAHKPHKNNFLAAQAQEKAQMRISARRNEDVDVKHDLDEVRYSSAVAKSVDFSAADCENYVLDMQAKTFGACLHCGKNKAAHKEKNKHNKGGSVNSSSRNQRNGSVANKVAPWQNNNAKPIAPAPVKTVGFKPSGSFSGGSSNNFSNNAATAVQKVKLPGVGPFGGFNPGVLPNAPKPILSNNNSGGSAGAKGACNEYRLDMTGATFGVCMCGYPRSDHARR